MSLFGCVFLKDPGKSSLRRKQTLTHLSGRKEVIKCLFRRFHESQILLNTGKATLSSTSNSGTWAPPSRHKSSEKCNHTTFFQISTPVAGVSWDSCQRWNWCLEFSPETPSPAFLQRKWKKKDERDLELKAGHLKKSEGTELVTFVPWVFSSKFHSFSSFTECLNIFPYNSFPQK